MEAYKTLHWTFYPKNNQLIYHDGKSIQLASRHNACLLALLEAKGEAVDYDTMLLRVWGTQFRDTNTIASVISELRKQINCGDPSLKYIVTIPKRGYRFNNYNDVTIISDNSSLYLRNSEQDLQAEINTMPEVDLPNSAPLTRPLLSLPSFKKNRRPILFSIILPLIISAFFIPEVYSFLSPKELNLSALTYERGIEYEYEVSQDKRMIIYTNEQDKTSYLIAKSFKTGEKQVLELTPNLSISSLALSLDGNQLAFIEHKNETSCIYLARLANSKIQLKEKKPISKCDENSFLFSIEFSPSGDTLFYAKSKSISDPYTISKHDLTTGLERNLTSPPTTGRGDYAPAITPDGSKLAFIRDIFWERSSVWTLDLSSGETSKLFELPYLIDKVSWLTNENIIFTHSDQLLSYSTLDNEIESIYEAKSPLHMPSVVNGSIYLSTGSLFNSYLSSIQIDNLNIKNENPSDNAAHTPTQVLADNSYYFLSNRSNKLGIWKNTGGSSQLITDSNELQNMSSLSDTGGLLLATTPGKLLQIRKETGEIAILKSGIPNLENYSYSVQKNTILYSKEVGESWYLESYNLKTKNNELLGVSGYTGHFFDDMIYLTEFRKPGLWQYNPFTREKSLLISDFKSFFTSKWAITHDYVFQLEKSSLKIWNRHQGYELEKEIQLNDTPRRISCGENKCIFDQYALGNTDIVALVESN